MNRWNLLFVAGAVASIFLPLVIALVGSQEQWKAAQERARARRIADARMNARLLRFDI